MVRGKITLLQVHSLSGLDPPLASATKFPYFIATPNARDSEIVFASTMIWNTSIQICYHRHDDGDVILWA
jgi:hypothetical protein